MGRKKNRNVQFEPSINEALLSMLEMLGSHTGTTFEFGYPTKPMCCLALPTFDNVPLGAFVLHEHGRRPSFTVGGMLNVPKNSLFDFSNKNTYTMLYYWDKAGAYIISNGYNFFAVDEKGADKLTLTNMRRDSNGDFRCGTDEDGYWEFTVKSTARSTDYSEVDYVPKNLYESKVSNVVFFDKDLTTRFDTLFNDGADGYAGYYKNKPALVFYASTESGIDIEPALLYDKVGRAMGISTIPVKKIFCGGRVCLVYTLCEDVTALEKITRLSEVENLEDMYTDWSEETRRCFLRHICLDNCMGTYNRKADTFLLYEGKPLGFVGNQFCMSREEFDRFEETVRLPSVFTAQMLIALQLYASTLTHVDEVCAVHLRPMVHSKKAVPLFDNMCNREELRDLLGETGLCVVEQSALAFGHPLFSDDED